MIKPTSVPTKRLQASISATATSFQLSDILGWNAAALTASDFGTPAYCVFRNANNTQIELMEFDPATIASTSITISKRGLNYTGDVTTELTARKYAWTKGTYVELGTHSPQLYQALRDYIDAAAIAGGVPATTTVAGIAKIGTQAQVDAGTAGDGTYSYIPTPALIRAKAYHDYAADAGASDAYAITITPAITAYATGQVFAFKANTANTGAATLAVSGLAAKTIKKNATEDLATGDIAAGQIVIVIYDGTNFQLQFEPNAGATATTIQTFTATNTWTKPTGLTYAIIELVGGGGGSGASAAGTANAAGGGGAGGYSRKLVLAAALGATETVTIGAGGAAGSGGAGGTGGTTSFGAHCSATGGGGGAFGVASTAVLGGAGGIGASGNVNSNGGVGGMGFGSGAAGAPSFAGSGGNSFWGGGASPNSNAGNAYGGGASGAFGGSTAGAAGATGFVIVTEFYT